MARDGPLCPLAFYLGWAAYSCQRPGTPFNSVVPRSLNSRSDPATRSLTVEETRISPGRACAARRAPMLTAMPVSLSPMTSHSPVCRPGADFETESADGLPIAWAQRIARIGPSKVAKKPSPAVSISRPRNRPSCWRTSAWWRSTSSRQRASPSSASFAVEPTMSVKRTVARTVSGCYGTEVRNEPLDLGQERRAWR